MAKITRNPYISEIHKILSSPKSFAKRKRIALETLNRDMPARIDTLIKSYGCSKNLECWKNVDFKKSYGNDIQELLGISEFTNLLKPLLECAVFFGPTKELICYNGSYIDTLVCGKRIIFANPLNTDSSGKAKYESWSKPSVIPVGYHKSKNATKNKSVFSKGLDVGTVSMEVFEKATGVLKNANRMMLYHKFDKKIGELSNNGGEATIVRVQCDRIRRKQGRGFQTEIHGYPISNLDLTKDLKKCPKILEFA